MRFSWRLDWCTGLGRAVSRPVGRWRFRVPWRLSKFFRGCRSSRRALHGTFHPIRSGFRVLPVPQPTRVKTRGSRDARRPTATLSLAPRHATRETRPGSWTLTLKLSADDKCSKLSSMARCGPDNLTDLSPASRQRKSSNHRERPRLVPSRLLRRSHQAFSSRFATPRRAASADHN